MMRMLRGLLLGAVAIGIWLALTAAPSSGGARGQTGYGDDTVPPRQLEVAAGETASDTGGGGSDVVKYIFIGGMVLVLGGGAAYLISYTDFLSRFRRS